MSLDIQIPFLRTDRKKNATPPEGKSFSPMELLSIQSGTGPAWSSRNAEALTNTGFCRNVVANRCIRLISESASALQLQVYYGNDLLTNHPLQNILDHPNPEQSSADFFQQVYGFLQTSGNAYLKPIALGKEIRALYSLRPDRVKITPGRTRDAMRYEYNASGKKELFNSHTDLDNMGLIHIKQFNPLCDYYGFSPLEVAAQSIDLHNAATSWNKSLLDNSARPSGALVYKPKDGGDNLTSEQFERLKSEMEQTFQGKWNVGRPLVLEGGLDWKQMSMSPADMDFLDAKHSSARDIALAFGVPPMLLGIPGDNTYTNYKEANISFWKQTIIPLLENVTTSLTRCLSSDGATITYDRSFIENMTPEHNQRLQRIMEADFLSNEEKRGALGFSAAPKID